MAGNEVHDPLRYTAGRQVASPVQRVESRVYDVGSVADVMQPRRSDESFALQRQRRRHMLSLTSDPLHMRPSSGQRFC